MLHLLNHSVCLLFFLRRFTQKDSPYLLFFKWVLVVHFSKEMGGWLLSDAMSTKNNYCTFVDICQSFTSTNSQCNAGAIRMLLCGLCVCTGDNPLANARGLSSRTGAQTIQY